MDNNPVFQSNNGQNPIPNQNPDSQSFSGYPQAPQPPAPPPAAPPPPGASDLDFDNSESFFEILKNNLLKVIFGIVAFLLIIFVIFGLILPNLNKTKNENVTLTYWGLWEDPSIMQGIISDFEKQNPNIKIDYSKQDPKDYRERLAARISNGSGPDIFRFHNSWYPMLSGTLLPLPESVISKNDFSKNYFPVAQEDLVKNGTIYGIPLEIDTLALFTNTDLLTSAGISPPTDWVEFRDDARSMTVKDTSGTIKTAGAGIGTFGNVDHAPDIISLLAVQNGANFSSFTNYSKEVSDAMRFFTSFSTDSSNVWDSTLDQSILNFSKGNVAMIFGYSWDYFTIKSLNPNLQFKIAPVPQLDKNNPQDIASYWAEGISTKSKHQREAELFLHFLSMKETQQKLYSVESQTRAFGEPYSDVSLVQSLKGDPNVAPFVGQANFATSSYFVDKTNDNGLNTKLNKYLENAINSISENTSPESATATLFQGYDQVLKEYGQ